MRTRHSVLKFFFLDDLGVAAVKVKANIIIFPLGRCIAIGHDRSYCTMVIIIPTGRMYGPAMQTLVSYVELSVKVIS